MKIYKDNTNKHVLSRGLLSVFGNKLPEVQTSG